MIARRGITRGGRGDGYRAGHLTRAEWLGRVWLHGRILESAAA